MSALLEQDPHTTADEAKIIPLYLPQYVTLDATLRNNKNLPEGAKIYLAELRVITSSTGKLWATDAQLAELKGISVSTLSKWHRALEKEGFLKSHISQEAYRSVLGKLRWRTKRTIEVFKESPKVESGFQKNVVNPQNFTSSNEPAKKDSSNELVKKCCYNDKTKKTKKTKHP